MSRNTLVPLADRGPLRVMFLLTSMPIGGAETLLVNLVRRLDRERGRRVWRRWGEIWHVARDEATRLRQRLAAKIL